MKACHSTSFESVNTNHGFALVAVLVFLVLLSAAAAASVQVYSTILREDEEAQLIQVGRAFRVALRSYVGATPQGQNPYPPDMAALLRDPRYPGVVRHLRTLYADPITGKPDWDLVMAPGGAGIIAIRSRSNLEPIKRRGFPEEFADFEEKHHYSEWIFSASQFFTPQGLPNPDSNRLPSSRS